MKKQTGSFLLDLEIGERVDVHTNSTSRLGSWWEAKCCLINNVNSVNDRFLEFAGWKDASSAIEQVMCFVLRISLDVSYRPFPFDFRLGDKSL